MKRIRSYCIFSAENRGMSKSLKVGGPGAFCGPRWGPGATPPVWVRGLFPLKLKAFLNLRYENPHFLAFYPVANSPSLNTLHCDERLSSRGTNQAQTKAFIQRLYTPNINNKKGTHIITFLSGHLISRVSNQNGVSPLYIMLEIHHSGREPSICLSTWAGAVVRN